MASAPLSLREGGAHFPDLFFEINHLFMVRASAGEMVPVTLLSVAMTLECKFNSEVKQNTRKVATHKSLFYPANCWLHASPLFASARSMRNSRHENAI